MFAHHQLLSPVVVTKLVALISFSVITTVNSIDPEYSLENRVDHFLAASLNTVLSVMHIDKKPINEEVTFWCSNRKNPNQTQTFLNDETLRDKINFKLPLAFIIHGWYDNRNRTWINEMTRDFLLFQDVNICVTDWNKFALQSYAISAENTKNVGNYLGKFIKYLNNAGMPYDRISLVGHSFGSHISGFAGSYVGGKINAIYGLDPAGPRFTKKQIKPPSERLDPTDARFVQVIHTDREYIGADFDMGHQDFYPNDGASPMPGCFFPAGQTGIHPTQFLCSHFKAVEYFTASLNPNHKFVGTQCFGDFDNFMIGLCDANHRDTFGIYANRYPRGRFYLTTSEAQPFAMGFNRQKRATIETVQKIKERFLRSLGFRL